MNLYLDINNEVFNLADNIIEDEYTKTDALKAINESGFLEFLRDCLKDKDDPIFEIEDFRFTIPCLSLCDKKEIFSVYSNLISFGCAISDICNLLGKVENGIVHWQLIRITHAIFSFINDFTGKYEI